ncbi:hypothetical protein [Nocardioides sp. Soil774]|uniref:hypothetical protein n=1 Tax=Nocardioides sp. Soil774 TaxID=1736408 RepID=UPI0012F97FBB|nr:hypothetical protein [Nocardioides sp. Soil774]
MSRAAPGAVSAARPTRARPRLLLVVAGVVAALPLAVLAVVRRSAALTLSAVGLAVASTFVAGLVVGADLHGCPRGVSAEACQEQARP